MPVTDGRTDGTEFIGPLSALPGVQKRLEFTEYFNKKLLPNGVLFLQETHSILKDKVRWMDEFNAKLFSHIAPRIHAEF